MNVLEVDPERPDPHAIAAAVQVLRDGGLVAFPTETVYGLGAHALDPDAIARIYAAKGRPAYNPLIVHLASTRDARRLAKEWPEAADKLAARFWPGPLTLVVPRADVVPAAVSAGLDTVALRLPAHPVARALLEAAGFPIAAPSANRSTRVSPTTAQHVRRGLGDRVDLILDGGPCPVGIESTVLSLAGDVPTLLRPGSISLEEIREVIGDVALPAKEPSGTTARPSPGMMDRHYAPRAEVRLFPSTERERIAREVERDASIGVIAFQPAFTVTPTTIWMPEDVKDYSVRVYGALHELDERGCRVIYVEMVPESPEWAGVRDRLRRAATAG